MATSPTLRTLWNASSSTISRATICVLRARLHCGLDRQQLLLPDQEGEQANLQPIEMVNPKTKGLRL
ncbi:MAG TPA: hypothetical protein PK177_04890 [Burkholderiaceae bacterium]|nr:hypothetical protein [Burkholderiaceae bacterium]